MYILGLGITRTGKNDWVEQGLYILGLGLTRTVYIRIGLNKDWMNQNWIKPGLNISGLS